MDCGKQLQPSRIIRHDSVFVLSYLCNILWSSLFTETHKITNGLLEVNTIFLEVLLFLQIP
jgi:tryptophan-rich sensory protein